jgi:hypothetical protein
MTANERETNVFRCRNLRLELIHRQGANHPVKASVQFSSFPKPLSASRCLMPIYFTHADDTAEKNRPSSVLNVTLLSFGRLSRT